MAHTSASSWAKRRFPHASITALPQVDEEQDVSEMLKAKKIDAFLAGRKHLESIATKSQAVRLLPEQRSQEHFGIAVAKRNRTLERRLNIALRSLKSSGELARLKQKWFVSERFGRR
jgi:ABC-type amino acid transport substrate-binding protein